MKLIKKIFKGVLYLLLIFATYFIIALILSTITIDRKIDNQVSDKTIYLNTNGVHLDIVIPIKDIDSLLLTGIKHEDSDHYLSFGWGDENFYIHTPTWDDLTFGTTFKAMFLKNPTLMHVTRYESTRSDWIEIEISRTELENLNTYILNSFSTSDSESKIILENKGYSLRDDFYRAKGNYSCLNTCNSWANLGFKRSGLKSCLWTPFDFGLMNKYE